MHDLTSTTGIVALAAAGGALLTLLFAMYLAARLRRIRQAQTAVMGDGAERDLVDHAQRVETGFAQLREWVEETLTQVEQRMEVIEQRIDGCVAHTAIVRYDAYNELSGHQSSSIALLDARRTGVVLSSIVHRDQARLYVKRVHAGEAEIALSPEEQHAVDAALGTVSA